MNLPLDLQHHAGAVPTQDALVINDLGVNQDSSNVIFNSSVLSVDASFGERINPESHRGRPRKSHPHARPATLLKPS